MALTPSVYDRVERGYAERVRAAKENVKAIVGVFQLLLGDYWGSSERPPSRARRAP